MKIKIKVGDTVDYHSVIGREITSTGHTVIGVYPKLHNLGCDCATISGKAGVVAIAALTPSPANMTLTNKEITCSEQKAR